MKIVFPELGGSNEWIQTSNPVTDSTIEGYQTVNLDFTVDGLNHPWGGLGLHTGTDKALITDTPTGSNWYMSIGCKRYWYGGIPGPRSNQDPLATKAVNKVELYIKRN